MRRLKIAPVSSRLKPTGFYRGRPQLYCKKLPSQTKSPCAVAAKIERDLTDPARKAAHLARQRERYARFVAAPGGREAMREKDRQRYARLRASPEGREQLIRHWRNKARPTGPTIVCEGEPDGVVPTCAECGRPTGFYHGRPFRFCPRQAGEVRSRCQIRHTNQRAARAVRDNPELRLLRNQQQREYDLRHPEKRREKVRRDQERRRADPKRYAAKLAAERERKARVRAQARVNRQAALPTGSVLLTASPRAPGRDLLANVYAVVPSHLPPDLRMEIISETAVLVLEGVDLPAAVAQASKSVRKNAAPLRYSYYAGIRLLPIVHWRLRLLAFPPRTDPPRRPSADREISRFPNKERPHMPGSATTLGRAGTRDDAPVRVAFRLPNAVGTREM